MANPWGCSRRHQRTALRCLLAVVLVTALICFGNWPPAASAQPDVQLTTNNLRTQHETSTKTARKSDGAQELLAPEHPDAAFAELPKTTHSPKDWSHVVKEIDALLDDELRIQALLAPITATGEPLLRDLAHRVRAFGEVLKLWESLNLLYQNNDVQQIPVIPRLQAMDLPSRTLTAAVHSYDRLRHFVNTFSKTIFPWTMLSYPDHMSLHAGLYSGRRGIVMTAGNNQADLLLTVIPSLRQLGCELPIEILYLGDEDLGEEKRDLLEALSGVVTRDLTLMIDDAGWKLQGWAAKAFAILMSTFREAIFIDADSFFFADPATLFDNEAYRTTGALFFKDRNLSPENKRRWIRSILPSPLSSNVKQNRMWTGESGHMQESGVLVIDKWRHFVPLLLATRLNGPDRDGNEAVGKRGVYEMMYGDKETFWLSWEMAGDTDYAFHEGGAGVMGHLTSTRPADPDKPEENGNTIDSPMVCSPQLVHLDRAGRPLWFNGWISASKDTLSEWQQFDVYLEEPAEVGTEKRKDAWSIFPGNVVCLQAEEAKEFTSKEQATLDAILDLAKKTDAVLGRGP